MTYDVKLVCKPLSEAVDAKSHATFHLDFGSADEVVAPSHTLQHFMLHQLTSV